MIYSIALHIHTDLFFSFPFSFHPELVGSDDTTIDMRVDGF